MNLILNVNKKYIKKLDWFITMLSINSNIDEITFHIITNENIEPLIKKLDINYILYVVDENNKQIEKENWNRISSLVDLNNVIFTRLLLFEVLTIDKYLFIDLDVTVQISIEKLCSKLKDKAMAAIKDDYVISNVHKFRNGRVDDELAEYESFEWFIENMNIEKYFNAGVMWFDFEKIYQIIPKEQLIKRRDELLSFFKKKKQDIFYWDQTIFSYIFNDIVELIDPRYNVQAINFPSIDDGYIYHWTGPKNPWDQKENMGKFVPCKDEILDLMQTIWFEN